jgi:subtilisin family serine protease
MSALKSNIALSLLFLLGFSLWANVNAQDSVRLRAFEPNELIVGYRTQEDRGKAVSDLSSVRDGLKVRGQAAESVEAQPTGRTAVRLHLSFPLEIQAQSVSDPNAELQILQEVASQIKARDDRVEYVHPNWILRVPLPFADVASFSSGGISPQVAGTTVPNDPIFVRGLHWHYEPPPVGMNAIGAWKTSTGSKDIVVAVVDTGILFDHPDVKSAGNTLPGYNFVSKGSGRSGDATDPGDACPPAPFSSWHGTHVAGTIGAVGSNNGIAIAGINWNVLVLPVRTVGPCGGTIADTADAITWAAGLPVTGMDPKLRNTRPAHVINMSLGGVGPCTIDRVGLLIDALEEVRKAGSVVVAAAGNESTDVANAYPGGCADVISVAASDRTGQLAGYSNYGAVTIMAPGVFRHGIRTPFSG